MVVVVKMSYLPRLFWALMIGSLTLAFAHGSSLGDSTSIDALQAFIVIWLYRSHRSF